MVLLNARRKDRIDIEDIESAKHEQISEKASSKSDDDSVWIDDSKDAFDPYFKDIDKIIFLREIKKSVWSYSHLNLPFGSVFHNFTNNEVFKLFDEHGNHILSISERRKLALLCWTGRSRNSIEIHKNGQTLARIVDNIYGTCFTCKQPGYLFPVYTKNQEDLIGYLDPINLTNSSLLGCVNLEQNQDEQYSSYKN